jgi:zinc transport system ATP-binding protein
MEILYVSLARMAHGKSTLVKCLLGLNKLQSGEIKLEHRIGYLPQKTEIQSNFPASIEEVVLSGTIVNNINKIWYTKRDRATASKVMKELDIYDIRKKCFRDLSGGQQQRVLIARAICATEKIIILDEPTNGLDPMISTQIYEMLAKLNKKRKLTVVMVSHDISRAIKYCNRVIEIRDGQVTYMGDVNGYKAGGVA